MNKKTIIKEIEKRKEELKKKGVKNEKGNIKNVSSFHLFNGGCEK